MDATQSNRTTLFVWAVILISAFTVAAITTLAILKPNDTSTGTIILGITIPCIMGFLAAAVQQVHLAVNSRLSELLNLTAASSLAQGKLSARVGEDIRVDKVAADLKEGIK